MPLDDTKHPICQSCGKPMEQPSDHGTEADGSSSAEYCGDCYRGGGFADPQATMDDMVQRVTTLVVQDLLLPEKKARDVALTYIPYLKRWQKT
jgi:hypothetical protein